jgi:protoporphyrinogen/coproporphyrinogen III oxidase
VTRRVVVVGAGITGLTLAYRHRRSGSDEVVVLEADDEPGGVIRSIRVGDLSIEAGPDSFLVRKPWAVELCEELGLGNELVEQGASSAQILTPRGLLPGPKGRFGIATSAGDVWAWRGMSVGARLRAMGEPLVPRQRDERDVSVGSLARRRLGRGATEAIIAPLVGGLYAGDVDRLSVEATVPELARWEREDGSLRAGVRRAMRQVTDGGGVRTPFATVRGGLRRIVERLVSEIGPDRVRTGRPAVAVRRDGEGFVVTSEAGDEPADVLVVTTPAPVGAELLRDVTPEASKLLGDIRAASTAVALLVYPEGTAALLPETSGFVAQRRLGLPITAATATSKKWPDPAFGDRAVLRAFAGGVGLEHQVDRPDREILERAVDALTPVYGLPAPEHTALVRWTSAMPQYEVGHLGRIAEITSCLPPNLHIAGAAFGGVGIPDRIREANALAERIAGLS